jgi:hypothetical protein
MVLANIGVGVVELIPAAQTNGNHRRSRTMQSTVTEQSSLIDTSFVAQHQSASVVVVDDERRCVHNKHVVVEVFVPMLYRQAKFLPDDDMVDSVAVCPTNVHQQTVAIVVTRWVPSTTRSQIVAAMRPTLPAIVVVLDRVGRFAAAVDRSVGS